MTSKGAPKSNFSFELLNQWKSVKPVPSSKCLAQRENKDEKYFILFWSGLEVLSIIGRIAFLLNQYLISHVPVISRFL